MSASPLQSDLKQLPFGASIDWIIGEQQTNIDRLVHKSKRRKTKEKKHDTFSVKAAAQIEPDAFRFGFCVSTITGCTLHCASS